MKYLITMLMLATFMFANSKINMNYDLDESKCKTICNIITAIIGARYAECMVNTFDLKQCQNEIIFVMNFTDIGTICDKASMNALDNVKKTYQEILEIHSQNIQKEMKKYGDEIQEAIKKIEKEAEKYRAKAK